LIPKLSIIIPNYNHADFLKQRLESIFNQTFQNFQVILLDDASTDNSKEILEQYANHPKVSKYMGNKVHPLSNGKKEYYWLKVNISG
jgi:glycosyltransferase involved in cell wall biosynthesis